MTSMLAPLALQSTDQILVARSLHCMVIGSPKVVDKSTKKVEYNSHRYHQGVLGLFHISAPPPGYIFRRKRGMAQLTFSGWRLHDSSTAEASYMCRQCPGVNTNCNEARPDRSESAPDWKCISHRGAQSSQRVSCCSNSVLFACGKSHMLASLARRLWETRSGPKTEEAEATSSWLPGRLDLFSLSDALGLRIDVVHK